MPIITALELTSQVRYIADGLTTEFPITFERISDNHVKAWLYDDEADEVTELARSVTDNVATITPPPAENTYVIIHRQTPKPALIDWSTTPGESRNARVLAERQSRYIALEALDWSQYPIRSIVATSPPPFTWRTVAAGDSLNKSDNNRGVDLTTAGTLHIPPAVGQEREFSTLVRLPIGTSTIAVNGGTIDGESSISITATASDRIIGIILRSAGVFNTAGRLQVSFGVEDIQGLGSVGADLVLADTQAEAVEALGLSNAVEYSVPTSGNATANQLVKGGDTRFTTPASTSALGMMSAADKTKLDGIAIGTNNYAHPTSDGSLHVPATGTTNNNKVLVAGATPGSFSWQQLSYSWLAGLPTLGTVASYNVPSSGDASATEVVLGGDSRMTNARPASDVYTWAKQPAKPTYNNTEVGAAATSHQHSAADLTSGTLPDARLPTRLGINAKVITDANQAVGNGDYSLTPDGIGNPTPGSYVHIRVAQHGDVLATQTAWAFAADGSADTKLWQRENNNGTWGSWYRLRWSEAEHAALWAAKAHNEHSALLQYTTTMRGSVTQTTSHTTSVTLNAAQGSIKMALGDIAAGASVDFQFNNSYITVNAMPVLARRGTEWSAVTATMLRFVPGYCIVRVTNTGTTAVTSAEPSLSFAILGVASA